MIPYEVGARIGIRIMIKSILRDLKGDGDGDASLWEMKMEAEKISLDLTQ